MIAFLEAKRAGLLGKKHWPGNIVSGVIVGVVALPLAMAFAIASGAKPEQGLYSAIVGGVVVAILGGSRLQIAGPTGAFIVILAGITAKHGIDGLQIATLMAGLILLLLGIARMGTIIKFIPDPVIVGFTAGIGVIIWVGQWKDFFGLPAIEAQHFHEKLWQLVHALPQLDPITTSLSLLSLLLVIFAPRLPGFKRVPGPLVALVVATLLQAIFRFDDVATIGSTFGGIPQGLPALHWPDITAARVIELIGPAFTIAMLGAIESLLSAVVADGMAGTRHDSNQELIGQGIANMATPLFGGFAVTGAIARTATNIRNGGTSPLAGIVHSITLVLIILFLAPLAVHVPLAAMAAILFVVAWNMSEVKHFLKMIERAPRADTVILLVTFGLTHGVQRGSTAGRRSGAAPGIRPPGLHRHAGGRGGLLRGGPVLLRCGGKLRAGAGQHAHRSARRHHPAALGAVHRHHRLADSGRGDQRLAQARCTRDADRGKRPRGRETGEGRDH
jgi:sulfate permease, SulP family